MPPGGVSPFGWTRRNRRNCAVVWGPQMQLEGLPRSGRGYKEGARIVAEELVRLWRPAREGVGGGPPGNAPGGGPPAGPLPAPPARVLLAPSPAPRVDATPA